MELSSGGGGEVEAVGANGELNIAQCERGGVGAACGVFPRAKEEKESQDDHVCDGLGGLGGVDRGGVGKVFDHTDRDWFDALRWRILLRIVPELALETEIQFAAGVEAWIRGPHCSERLANAAKGTRSGVAADRLASSCIASCADPVKEDLKDRNWVGDVLKERVDGQVGAKVSPEFPVGVGGDGATRRDAKVGGLLRRAEITEEIVEGGGVQRCQDLVWG